MTYAIKIKPLSVNRAWKGKRFKTQDYKDYEQELLFTLPPVSFDPREDYKIYLEFGLSSRLSDWDNPIKPFQDILCKKYGIDDRDIWEAHVKKVKVEKGEEYVKFNLEVI